MLDDFGKLVNVLKNNVRVNVTLKTVEIFDEFGVKVVLRDLTEAEFEVFKKNFTNF